MLKPRYIVLKDITDVLGDKVSITDDDPTGNSVPTDIANQFIAYAECDVETDLQIRFIAPLQTATGDWTTASPTTIGFLKKLFVARSIGYILRNYFGRSGQGTGSNVMGGDFYESAEIEYDMLLKRVLKKLPNGLYAYQIFPDLVVNNTGINPYPTGGSTCTNLGIPEFSSDYAQEQIINPMSNWAGSWGEIAF